MLRRGALCLVRLVCLVCLVACGHDAPATITAAEGQRVVAFVGDHVTVGALQLDVDGPPRSTLWERVRGKGSPGRLLLVMHEPTRRDGRYVSGHRVVKFGAHRIDLEASGTPSDPSVTFEVTPYVMGPRLSAEDARMVADEELSPHSHGPLSCLAASPSPDGKTFFVRCSDLGAVEPDREVTVDAATGAVVSVVQKGD
ncbi:MAG: hypothetical protein ACRELB_11320 [Polyangiaceae bacterium]